MLYDKNTDSSISITMKHLDNGPISDYFWLRDHITIPHDPRDPLQGGSAAGIIPTYYPYPSGGRI